MLGLDSHFQYGFSRFRCDAHLCRLYSSWVSSRITRHADSDPLDSLLGSFPSLSGVRLTPVLTSHGEGCSVFVMPNENIALDLEAEERLKIGIHRSPISRLVVGTLNLMEDM